jgi:hypothetical protein
LTNLLVHANVFYKRLQFLLTATAIIERILRYSSPHG